jgi:hypothetical protein
MAACGRGRREGPEYVPKPCFLWRARNSLPSSRDHRVLRASWLPNPNRTLAQASAEPSVARLAVLRRGSQEARSDQAPSGCFRQAQRVCAPSSVIPALRRPSQDRSSLSSTRASPLKRALYAFNAAIVLARVLESAASPPAFLTSRRYFDPPRLRCSGSDASATATRCSSTGSAARTAVTSPGSRC